MVTTQVKKYKILVVDDNSENIRIIGSILRQNAYQAGFATSGQQALDILTEKAEYYDLILLDVNMPGMDGFEVCRKLREIKLLNDIPVIFLTANTEPEYIIEGFNSGGQDYVTKPFHGGELLSRISTHIELKESRDKLKRMNIILEEMVKERTMELEEANRKLEEANVELQQLDHAKADFLGIISHEINTPLTGIMGFTEILKETLADSEYLSMLEYLSFSAQRLHQFAKSSLTITELRTSPARFKKIPLNICEVCEAAIESHRLRITEKKLDISIDHGEIPPVEGNSELIRICFFHLLDNAINYTPAGSTITITAGISDQKVNVTIEDNGPGFTEKALQNLFRPFVPGSIHVDRNKGLNLHLVKMILDFHHAGIRISNAPKGGAKVEVFFTKVMPLVVSR